LNPLVGKSHSIPGEIRIHWEHSHLVLNQSSHLTRQQIHHQCPSVVLGEEAVVEQMFHYWIHLALVYFPANLNWRRNYAVVYYYHLQAVE
jgi:hypothetical protein